jgi:hypothetical protein
LDVFEKPELTARPEYSADLGEGGALVGHGAQHERGDSGVELAVTGGQVVGQAVDDRDGDRRGLSGFECGSPQVRLWFHREDFGDLGWVVGEHAAVAGADLDHSATQPRSDRRAVLGAAGAVHRRADALVEAGE